MKSHALRRIQEHLGTRVSVREGGTLVNKLQPAFRIIVSLLVNIPEKKKVSFVGLTELWNSQS